jgi:hypothetical protein
VSMIRAFALLLAAIALSSIAAPARAEEPPGFDSIDPVVYSEMFVDAVHQHQAGHKAESFRKFLRLACGGDKQSQEQVGLMYLAGEGVSPNSAMAYLWLKVAAEFNYGAYRTILKKFDKLLTPQQIKRFGELAGELVAEYGLRATNMTCRAESSATFSSNIKDTVVCSPKRSGSLLLIQRCYEDEVRIGKAASDR